MYRVKKKIKLLTIFCLNDIHRSLIIPSISLIFSLSSLFVFIFQATFCFVISETPPAYLLVKYVTINRIGGVMVSVLTLRVLDHGFEPRPGQSKAIKLILAASPLSMRHYDERSKTCWPGIRIMCPSGWTCISAHCCFLFQWASTIKNQTKRYGIVESIPHHHLIDN